MLARRAATPTAQSEWAEYMTGYIGRIINYLSDPSLHNVEMMHYDPVNSLVDTWCELYDDGVENEYRFEAQTGLGDNIDCTLRIAD